MTSCENIKKPIPPLDATILHINSEEKKVQKYSVVFDTYNTIYLEASNDFLIDRVKQIKYFQEKIFVLDRTYKLFVFSDSGNGLTVIDKRGIGSNEYIDIRGFDIDKERNELVVNTFPNKIMRFSFEGDFLSETQLKIKGTDIVVIGDNEMALYTQNIMNQKDKNNHNLFIISDNAKSYKGYEPSLIKDGRILPEFQYLSVFSRFNKNNETLFAHPFSNKILSLTESKEPTIKYEIDFKNIDLINLSEDKIKNYKELVKRMNSNKYAYGINSYWENSTWINFSVNTKGESKNFIFDKQENSKKSYIFEDDILGIRPTPIYSTDEFIICYADAENIFSLWEYLSMRRIKPSPEIKKIISKVEETGNPVIFKFYFK